MNKIIKKYNPSTFQDISFIERIKLIEIISRKYHHVPEISFSYQDSWLIYSQEKIISQKMILNHSALERFSIFLDEMTSDGFVHGDLNRKNILYDGKDYILVDLEPSIKIRKDGKFCFKVTPPYISIDDMKENNITSRTDKVGFYYFIKRLKGEFLTSDIPKLFEIRCRRKNESLPEKEENFCKKSFFQIFREYA